MDKTFIADQYIAETNTLIVDFSDGSTSVYDLSQLIPKRIKSVVALDNYILQLEFDNHEIKLYNMTNSLTGVFEFLNDVKEFQQVKLIQDNQAIGWQCQGEIIDLWVDSLYYHSYQK